MRITVDVSVDAERKRARTRRSKRLAKAKLLKAKFQENKHDDDEKDSSTPAALLHSASSTSILGLKRTSTVDTVILEDNIQRMKRPRHEEDLRNLLGTAGDPAPITLPPIIEEEPEDVETG